VVPPQSEAQRLAELRFLVEPSKYKPLPAPEESEVQRIGPRAEAS
jgi:hypothetical protein